MSHSSRTRNILLLLFFPGVFGLAFLLGKTNQQQAVNAINDDSFVVNKTSKIPAEDSNSGNTAHFALSASLTPIIKQRGIVKGINSTVKFEKDFETSLKIQELPDVWFEYVNEDNQAVKAEIPAKVKEFIKKRWFNTLKYACQNQTANDRETKININRNLINDAVVYAVKIADLPIVTPLERRKISEKEAFDLIRLTAKLAIERYEELQRIDSQINSPKIDE